MNPLTALQGMNFAPPGSYQDLLSQEQMKAAQQQGMLGFGANMLANSGWSRQRPSLGAALGQSVMAGNQMQNQAMRSGVQNELMKLQMEKMRTPAQPDSPFSKINPKDFDPQSVQRFQQTGNYADLRAVTPEGAMSARELKIQDYLPLFGGDRTKAMDLVDGNLSVTTSPNARGEITMTNKRTGESFQTTARQAEAAGLRVPQGRERSGQQSGQSEGGVRRGGRFVGQELPPAKPAPGVDDSVVRESQQREIQVNRALSLAENAFDAIPEGVGAANMAQRGIDNLGQTISFNMLPTFFSEETIAKGDIEKFNQFAKAALVNNPRFPMGEQAIVQNLLTNPNDLTANPEVESVRFLKTVQALQQARENDRAYVEGRPAKYIDRERIGNKYDPQILPANVPIEQADQVFPPGTYFIGPDGNTYEVY